MRIDNSNVLRMYESTQKATKPDASALSANGAGAKTDRVLFSAEGAKTSAALREVPTDAAEIEGAASPERLASLAAQISEGTYNISTDKIVGAMLNIMG